MTKTTYRLAQLQRDSLLALPLLLVLVFAMHFRRLTDFMHFRLEYIPRTPSDVVHGLIAAGNTLFLAFWDLDNWMLLGSLLLLAGFIPMGRAFTRLECRS